MAKRKTKRSKAKRFGAFSAANSCNIGPSNKRFMAWLAKGRNGHLDREFLRLARQETRKRGYMPATGVKAVAKAIKKKMLKTTLVCKIPWMKKSNRACQEMSLFKSPNYEAVAGCYLSKLNWGYREK